MNLKTNVYINNNINENNNQKVYYSYNKDKINIKNTIDNLFKFTNIVYDKKVIITTKEEILEKNIIAKDNNNLITNMYEVIPIDLITDIKEI